MFSHLVSRKEIMKLTKNKESSNLDIFIKLEYKEPTKKRYTPIYDFNLKYLNKLVNLLPEGSSIRNKTEYGLNNKNLEIIFNLHNHKNDYKKDYTLDDDDDRYYTIYIKRIKDNIIIEI